MTERRVWTAEIVLDETPERTDAQITLHAGGSDHVARGHARRNPHDPNVPRIGEELATARALAQLADRLRDESARILEQHLGRKVVLLR